MSFLKSKNPNLAPRFAGIANAYKSHGEHWRVRWDYAFFQMAVETNFLSFKRGSGRPGDVSARQNNFAGLGTVRRGVTGESFPDVTTGVLAQIQHLVVYSGERVADPVGERTKLMQDDILGSIAHLKGRTTFADLSRRWAADRRYGSTIEWVASRYRDAYCKETTAKANPEKERRTPNIFGAKRTAALGGPGEMVRIADAPPVRTIWSRSERQNQVAQSKDAKPREQPAAHVPVLPEKAARAARPLETAGAHRRLVAPMPVEVTPEIRAALRPASLKQKATNEPRAFAFAAAMRAVKLTADDEDARTAPALRCRVLSASYGGTKTLLLRAQTNDEVRYTALTVLDGFENSMLANYMKAHAPNGTSLGVFENKDAAVARAKRLCSRTVGTPYTSSENSG